MPWEPPAPAADVDVLLGTLLENLQGIVFVFLLPHRNVCPFVLKPVYGSFPTSAREQETARGRRTLNVRFCFGFQRIFLLICVTAGSPRAAVVGQLQGGGRGWRLMGESFSSKLWLLLLLSFPTRSLGATL